ncbi:MAG: Polyphosphate glucokinase [Anaerolineales bacterium]|nr:Polyphosphate glucokinase [Anaerolineales bacterium]
MEILGVDVGGSGIKGAPVDTETGELLAKRHRIKTPKPATPDAVAETVAKLAEHFEWSGVIGCGFPAAIQNGIARTASNIDDRWIGTNAAALFADATGCRVRVINDADAAGLAEMQFGAGQGHQGVVLLVTIGTGLGTALFTEGKLVPNVELGHIVLKGKDAERYASDAARKKKDLSWKKWGKRFNRYLRRLEDLIWPDLFILGGGASKRKKYKKYAHRIKVEANVTPAEFRNEAGIVGAALSAKPT